MGASVKMQDDLYFRAQNLRYRLMRASNCSCTCHFTNARHEGKMSNPCCDLADVSHFVLSNLWRYVPDDDGYPLDLDAFRE